MAAMDPPTLKVQVSVVASDGPLWLLFDAGKSKRSQRDDSIETS